MPKIKVHRSSFIVHRIFSLRSTIIDIRHTIRGFTLIELLVTISIIAILATVGIVVYSSAQKSGRISKRVQDLQALRTALELYKSSVGTYPNQSASANCTNSTAALASLVPTYMPSIPNEPSGSCYLYQSNAASLSTEYKISVSSSEMTKADYQNFWGMIDPNRDGTSAASTADCVIEATDSANFNPTAWSFQTNNACNF